jgi:mevalonate kinase
MSYNSFPSKILLFGEYIVLLRPQALLMPFPHFKGRLTMDDPTNREKNNTAQNSNQVLLSFFKYLRQAINKTDLSKNFDFKKFNTNIENGMYFNSNIPFGCGLGSSGALTAAVYSKYAKTKDQIGLTARGNELLKIKNDLALIESFFHAQSSGIDPLVSLLNMPLLFSERGIETVNFPTNKHSPLSVFLIDTNTIRNTGNLVNQFLSDCKDQQYNKLINTEFRNLNESCINSLLSEDYIQFFQKIMELSAFQFQYFQPMIPHSVRKFWDEGLQSGNYGIKLCGAGGGGYMLGFTLNDDVLKKLKDENNLPIIKIDF